MTGPLLGVLATVVLAGLLWIRRRFLVVTVHGVSMEPTYREGERLLIRRASLAAVRPGQVVVMTDPVPPGQWIVKRAAAVPGDPVPEEVAAAARAAPGARVPAGCLVLLGDNPAASLDSRRFGYFSGGRLLGVVSRRLGAHRDADPLVRRPRGTRRPGSENDPAPPAGPTGHPADGLHRRRPHPRPISSFRTDRGYEPD
ncbi:S26 family signal peptidase [Streptosporangium amethystogenes subsp. fukuiense]|uniref:S26 family signal peptidase n=1 Tax=Streptosporangium amethystogenes subsp. fukuiense TaxID=698418 RepID=A0ABW2T567_9ACTN